MSKVNICNVVVKDNPCCFLNPFQFEITFECIENLEEDLEWKIIYVGSAESEEFDQVLDTVVVGPLCDGRHMFVFEADPPDVARIPKEDVVGVTVVLLTCSYRKAEFIRVGYYVNNEYTDPELRENPPAEPDFNKLQRNILATCPRVTRFKIDWGGDGNQESLENEANSATNGSLNPSLSLSLSLLDQQSNQGAAMLQEMGLGEKSTDGGMLQLFNGGNSNLGGNLSLGLGQHSVSGSGDGDQMMID